MKKILIVIIVLLVSYVSYSQDVIYKNDKTEIKAKVVEITETSIKYKKWENQTGPLYNISINEVFMVMYENGQREMIKPATPVNQSSGSDNQSPNQNNSNQSQNSDILNTINQSNRSSNTGALNIDTTLDFKNLKVKYVPGRILYNLNSTISSNAEGRLLKNIMNLGLSADYTFVADQSYYGLGIYLAPYLAVNRMVGNYENQDKGLFIFGRAGVSTFEFETFGVNFGAGLDYLISPKFGITGIANFGTGGGVGFQTGICWGFGK